MPEPKLVGHVCYGSKMGLATLVVSDQFFKIKRSWRFEERCTAVLFGAFFYDSVCSGLQERFWMYMRHSFGLSPTYHGSDVEEGPTISTSVATSMWSWGCCRRFGNVQRTLYRTHFSHAHSLSGRVVRESSITHFPCTCMAQDEAVCIFQNSSYFVQHVVHYTRVDQHFSTLHPHSFLSFGTTYLNFLDFPF